MLNCIFFIEKCDIFLEEDPYMPPLYTRTQVFRKVLHIHTVYIAFKRTL